MSLGNRFLLLFLLVCSGLAGQRKPNIILIMTDDQGWGDLSYHGNTNLSTPNIDQIARSGLSFSNFYVTPVCSPTRAEVLTGRYHVRSGVRSTSSGGERIDLDEVTIAEVLKDHGYRTALYGKWHSGSQPPYHPNSRGFDEFYGFTSGHWGNYFSPMLEHNGSIIQGKGFLPDDLTEQALQFINKDLEKPFFVFLAYNTPHSPMQVPDRFWQKQMNDTLNLFAADPSQEDTMFTKAALAMVENVDENIGRIQAHLKQHELEEETILLFMSDNGPNGHRWNGGMKGIKGSTDEGGIKSPLFISWKGHLSEGREIDLITSSVDLFPTLLKLADVTYDSPHALDGVDFLNKEYDNTERFIFSHWQGRVSVRSQRFRLDHENALYELASDPKQSMDVRKLHESDYDQLVKLKQEWIREVASEISMSDTRPFTVGHPDFNFTHLPARDAQFTGGVTRSNRWPNCSFLTTWKKGEDSIYWDVDVIEEGSFSVEMYYTCSEESIGSVVTLASQESSLSQSIAIAHDPPLIGALDDRIPRKESYVKDFKPLLLGNIDLKKGRQRLTLQANFPSTDHPGIDFRLLVFKRSD